MDSHAAVSGEGIRNISEELHPLIRQKTSAYL